jgi:SecD/SecF fusion protein
MSKPSIWKWLILICLVMWSVATVMQHGFTLGLDLQGGTSFVLAVDLSEIDKDPTLDEKAKDDLKRDAPERALEVIRNRIDALGGTEPLIYLEPQTKRVVVQIPGLEAADYERAKANIARAAFLEFKMVHESSRELSNAWLSRGEAPMGYKPVSVGDRMYLIRDPESVPAGVTEAQLRKALRTFKAPPNHELMLQPETVNNAQVFEPVYVERRRQLTGQHLETAGVQQDYGKLAPTYVVTLRFNPEGTKRFSNLTRDYAPDGAQNLGKPGRQMAIILDGNLYSAPVIQTPIYSGSAQIEGNFSFETAQDLALVLRAGSLLAPVKIIEERTVDPTLGHDSIESGKRAVLLGLGIVVVFMVGYYLLAGVVADVALLLDLVLLPLGMMIAAGFLSLFTGGGEWSGPIGLPTLTLAGIAGIVLTIGMAVDANVLIFERMREEFKAGKRYASAVDAGYDKAFSTILDANVTTLLTAVILFWQGSGPIRGFAITLSAGILVSMYVALVVTRMSFDLLGFYTKVSTLKMLSAVRDTAIDFLRYRKIAPAISAIVILSCWVVFFIRGPANFGVDFTGGASITYEVTGEKPPMEEIRDFLAGEGLDAQLQFQQELVADEAGKAPDEFLVVKVPYEQGTNAVEVMSRKFPTNEVLRRAQVDQVGPQVGRELTGKGIMSLVWALIGIVIYITVRFEFGFAVGAIAALVHDVLATVGIYCLLGRQLSLPIVAALLTIVGYSVNDTIVVFDRIREDLGLHKGRPFKEIANLSINQTLSRTLLTSFTTLLTVLMLLIFGGGAINDFALALLVGIIVGTYSSIFIATPVATFWHRDPAPAAKVPEEKKSKKK